ncbi:hypothetical protein RHGRI_014895 [Rhododendron griersonianum]|uniref:F-box associated beta-propeller type 3 domain-containing protein n=1 Tax=Rhododendron griersonianum TaxID=479676 RepID=A0AAV6KB70_9ERIC|nr:hypothetical protein RHGRI_014895 [Rhododendron griersonianum]
MSCSLRAVLHKHSDTAVELDCPFKGPHRVIRNMCSCDGLVCFAVERKVFLWNPSTRKFVTLPDAEMSYQYHPKYGLGYDESIDDYKVVGFFSSSICYREVQVMVPNFWIVSSFVDTQRVTWGSSFEHTIASSSFKALLLLFLRVLRLRGRPFELLAQWPSLRALRLCDFFEFKALQRLRVFRLRAIASSSLRLPSVFKLLGSVAAISLSFKASQLFRAFRLCALGFVLLLFSVAFAALRIPCDYAKEELIKGRRDIEASLYHVKKVLEAYRDVEANALLKRCCHDRMVLEAFHNVKASRCHVRRFLKLSTILLKPADAMLGGSC